jgi:hypothetical protein
VAYFKRYCPVICMRNPTKGRGQNRRLPTEFEMREVNTMGTLFWQNSRFVPVLN